MLSLHLLVAKIAQQLVVIIIIIVKVFRVYRYFGNIL